MKSLPLAFLLLGCGQKPAPGATDLEFVYEPTCEDAEEDVVIEGEVTWTDQVGPIVMEKCSGCHVDGGIAPFALDSFSTASPMAAAIAGAVTAKRMPPWPPSSCGDCQEFQHDRSLTDVQIATIAAWVDQGAPEGGGVDLEADAPAGLEREDALVTWEGADSCVITLDRSGPIHEVGRLTTPALRRYAPSPGPWGSGPASSFCQPRPR